MRASGRIVVATALAVVGLGVAARVIAGRLVDPSCWGTWDTDIYITAFVIIIVVTGIAAVGLAIWAVHRLGERVLAIPVAWFVLIVVAELIAAGNHAGC